MVIPPNPSCRNTLLAALLLASPLALFAADIEVSETLQLPECHSLGWVRENTQPKDAKEWDAKLDEAKWGTPSENQATARNWVWNLDSAQWLKAVADRGEGKREDCTFDLWIPDGVEVVKGVVAISAHGSGLTLYKHPELRKIAKELHLAVFKFIGNPVQRGFWPKEMLYERLKALGTKAAHHEVEHAPLFLYGHSNGTGFSAIFPATESARVWAWVSMRPGITHQVYQPGAARVPGLIIFGEDDPFLTRPSREENLAVVRLMRQQHNAVWNYAVEPKTGHGPGRMHWYRGVRADFFEQLTAEVKAPARNQPKGKKVWQKKAGKANEGLDCTVYALHAARALARRRGRPRATPTAPATPPKQQKKMRGQHA